MKIASTTFYCDASKCRAVVTVTSVDTEAYIALVGDKGWKTDTLYGGWKHYCPDHHEPQSRKAEK